MIDTNSQFFAILTNVGMAKQANADALGIPWKLTEMGVGDANGTDPIPSAAQTSLISEWRRRPLNQLKVDPTNSAVIIAEQVIPADEGGKWIREIGLYDADGDLVAVANCAPSFKPVLSQGSGRTQVVRMNFIVSSTGNITLKIDPSVVLATREYVDTKILEELYKLDSKQSVLVATTANIALAGLQVIDGVSVPAGARVLVKNQTVAKDNGIWIAAAPVWTRAADADTNAEVTSALLVSVEQGATLADSRWQLVTDGVIVLGTTALNFQDVTQGYAPINSPALLGTPTAPTQAQFDHSLKLVNSAFLKRVGVEYSGFAPLTASTALGASSVGGMVSAASATPINITLPPTAGVPEGAAVEVVNAGAGAVTVLPSGLDVLASPVAGVITVVLGMGDNAEFVKVSGTWRLRGGSMALKYAAVMSGPNWITPPLFDSTLKLSTTEFVQRALGSFSGIAGYTAAGTITLTAADIGKHIVVNNATTVVLPAASSVAPGATLHILISGVTDATVTRAGADVITRNDGQNVNGILLRANTAISLRQGNGGTTWIVCGGDASLQFSPVFFASLGTNGYMKQPNGLIIQWGAVSCAAGTTSTGTFPIAFPNASFSVVISGLQGAGNQQAYAVLNSHGLTSFAWNAFLAGGGSVPVIAPTAGSVQGRYIAFGS